jgi:FkbM family methyltransferase
MYVDLRETVCSPLVKWGCFPHQIVEDRFISKLLCSGDIVYDVGASVGHSALIIARSNSPEGHVFSFEPSPKSLRLLQINAQLQDNITVVPKAVSDSNGTTFLMEKFELDKSQIFSVPKSPNFKLKKYDNLQEISTITLDSHNSDIGHRRVHLLKIDVEGHEAAVLRGAKIMIQKWTPIILFEALSEEKRSECEDEISSFCRNEYEIFGFCASGLTKLNEKNLKTLTNNFLAVPGWATSLVNKVQSEIYDTTDYQDQK